MSETICDGSFDYTTNKSVGHGGSFDYQRVSNAPKFITFEEAVARGKMLKAKEPVDSNLRLSLIDGSVEPDNTIRALTGKDLLDLLPSLSPRINLEALTGMDNRTGILG